MFEIRGNTKLAEKLVNNNRFYYSANDTKNPA